MNTPQPRMLVFHFLYFQFYVEYKHVEIYKHHYLSVNMFGAYIFLVMVTPF